MNISFIDSKSYIPGKHVPESPSYWGEFNEAACSRAHYEALKFVAEREAAQFGYTRDYFREKFQK